MAKNGTLQFSRIGENGRILCSVIWTIKMTEMSIIQVLYILCSV